MRTKVHNFNQIWGRRYTLALLGNISLEASSATASGTWRLWRWSSEKGLSGLGQNNHFLEHSRRTHQKAKLGILGGAPVWGRSGFNPLQSNPLKPFSQARGYNGYTGMGTNRSLSLVNRTTLLPLGVNLIYYTVSYYTTII